MTYLGSTTPSRVFVRVDVGSPKVQSRAPTITERASLVANDGGYLVNEVIVKCGRQKDGHRERRCVAKLFSRGGEGHGRRSGDPVKSLAPPPISWESKSRCPLALAVCAWLLVGRIDDRTGLLSIVP